MIERDAFGEGQHRWSAELLNLARDYGFKPRACRAQTKDKAERFNGYLKRSFITPLAASLHQSGLVLDSETANGKIGPWLDEVANRRIHGTTGEKPLVLLEKERLSLLSLPLPPQSSVAQPIDNRQALPMESLQHPLSRYDQLLGVMP